MTKIPDDFHIVVVDLVPVVEVGVRRRNGVQRAGDGIILGIERIVDVDVGVRLEPDGGPGMPVLRLVFCLVGDVVHHVTETRRPFVADGRIQNNVGRRLISAAARESQLKIQFIAGSVGDDVHRAMGASAAIERALGPTQHFDPFTVEDVHSGEMAGVEATAHERAVSVHARGEWVGIGVDTDDLVGDIA